MPRQRLAVGSAGEITTSRRDGYWRARARFRDYDGRRRQIEATGSTKGKAKTRLREKISTRHHPSGEGSITETTTVTDLARLWLDEIRRSGRTPQTIARYEHILDSRGLPALGDLTLAEARVSILDRAIKAVADQAPAQAYLLRVVLRQMFAMAVRHDALEVNPASATATVNRPKKQPVALRAADIAKLRDAVRVWRNGQGAIMGPRPDGNLPAAVDLMLATGVRISEALALRWEDVDLNNPDGPTITVAATMVYLKGQGTIRQDKPKTASGHRVLHLPDFAVDALRDLCPAHPEPNQPVFTTKNSTHLSSANFRRSLRSALTDAGLDAKQWHPHQLRVTVGTALAHNAGVGIENAAAVLGHSGTEITRKHYVERLRQAPDVNAVLQTLIEATDDQTAA